MARLLCGGGTTFKLLPRKLFVANRGVKNWGIESVPSNLKHLKKGIRKLNK